MMTPYSFFEKVIIPKLDDYSKRALRVDALPYERNKPEGGTVTISELTINTLIHDDYGAIAYCVSTRNAMNFEMRDFFDLSDEYIKLMRERADESTEEY